MKDAVLRRQSLLRWSLRFLLANIALAMLIAMGYLQVYDMPANNLVRAFVPMMMISHFTLLGAALWIITFTPLLILAPPTKFSVWIAALVFGIAGGILVLDVNLFSTNQYHLNALNIRILGVSSWLFFALFLLILVCFELFLGRIISNSSRTRLPGAKILGTAIIGCTLGAQAIHIWADASYYVPVTSFARFLPGIRPFTAESFVTRYGLVDYNQARERALSEQLGELVESPLNYPKHELACADAPPEHNVVFIVVDTLRADVLNPELMPYTSKLGTGMQRFDAHISGGIATRPGMFSLFYSLPGTYWNAVKSSQVGPVLISQFIDNDYAIGLFSTHDLYKTELDRTAFTDVLMVEPVSSSAGKKEWQRDAATVSNWEAWLEKQDPAQPFFGAVMLNSLAQYSAPPEYFMANGAVIAKDDLPKKEQYESVVRYNDELIATIAESLVRKDIWDNSVVVITSDHGEEFDDSGLGYWGHGKAYNQWQMQVPMLIHWPGREPRVHNHRTSHLDIAPTFMQDFFSCTNDPSDYASGKNLFNGKDWDWIVAGSYHNIALIEPDQVTTSYKGMFEVRDANYQIVENPVLRNDVLADAVAETSTFFQHGSSP